MSCSHCDPTDTTVVFTNAANDVFVLNAFATDGDAVAFGATEQDGLDVKYDSYGNILTAGSKNKSATVTLRVSCDGAKELWAKYKGFGFDDCGSLNVTDNCCTSEVFQSARLVSINRPNIGDTVDYFEIEFMGMYPYRQATN